MYKKPKFIHTCGELHLIRQHQSTTRTLSTLLAMDEQFVTHYLCVALELPFEANNRSISCIPPGRYKAELQIHDKFMRCIFVKNVADRSGIFFHVGNFLYQTKGCVLVGTKFKDLDNNGTLDVDRSGEAMFMLWWTMKNEFTLIIH